ncbi:hypothetical protein [Brevundimonas sp.]|uniref:hypothetical protein n=1 Tax=Brevundimonas sp. TaxID=1871086 RepID=UPI003568B0A1
MRYETGFAAVSAMTPLDPPVYVGAEPFVLGAILLGLILACVFGWLVGGCMAKSGGQRQKRSGPPWTSRPPA